MTYLLKDMDGCVLAIPPAIGEPDAVAGRDRVNQTRNSGDQAAQILQGDCPGLLLVHLRMDIFAGVVDGRKKLQPAFAVANLGIVNVSDGMMILELLLP